MTSRESPLKDLLSGYAPLMGSGSKQCKLDLTPCFQSSSLSATFGRPKRLRTSVLWFRKRVRPSAPLSGKRVMIPTFGKTTRPLSLHGSHCSPSGPGETMSQSCYISLPSGSAHILAKSNVLSCWLPRDSQTNDWVIWAQCCS